MQFGIQSRAFLGGNTHQVQPLQGADVGLAGVEPAGQQNLVDQLVEFVNVACDLVLGLGTRLGIHQLQAHADAGQW